MRRLLVLLALFLTETTVAQRTFQSTQFDLSGDLPFEDPSVLAQAEGVPTHHLKNELKPVKIQKPAEAAVVPPVPQPAAAVQPLPPPLPIAPVASAAPALPTFAPFTFPTLPPHPSLTPFTFPTHPPLPTLAPFTLPTLPPHPTIAPFTFPTPAPAPTAPVAPAAPIAPGSAPVPQSSDYDEPAQKVEPTTVAPKAVQPQPVPQSQVQPQQSQYFTPEYVRYVQQYYPDYFRQHQQYFLTHVLPEPPRPQAPVQPQQVQPQRFQPQQVQPQLPQFRPAAPVQPLLQQQRIAQPQPQIVIRPSASQPLVNGVHTAVGVGAVQQATPAPKKVETVVKVTPPSRTANWFRETVDTKDCKKDLKKVARQFKDKFPNYLQKGGKDAALADLVEKRLVECEEKGSTGHWDKVETLLPKVQLSKSEESECRAGLIQERISCHNLLNFSCQFTSPSYQFKLVPARIIIQEARQAEGGAEKCRKVVRLVKKRLDG